MKRPVGFDRTPADASGATVPSAPRGRRETAIHGAEPVAGDPSSARSEQASRSRSEEPSPAQQAARLAREARKRLRLARRERRGYERREVRRFTRRSRRRRAAWISAAAAVAALALFVLIGAFSPLMALTTIEVRGADRISSDSIISALSDQLGRPLATIDQSHVETVLATFPLIRSYSTQSSPPNTLVVSIVERTPIALVHSSRGFDLVDSAGVVIETTAKRTSEYPLISTPAAAPGAGDPSAGHGDNQGFAAAVSVLLALPDSLRGSVDTVTARTHDDVTLSLADGGPRVVWGSAENAEIKAVVLARLLESTNPAKVTEYDVSSPNAAVVR